MKIINEIIDILSSENSNVTSALLKTKVLLFKLGEKQLLDWVNGELQGYPLEANLPDYRVVRMIIRGNISNGHYTQTNHVLPLMHLEDDIRDYLELGQIDKSIAVVEEYAREDNIQKTVPPEVFAEFDKSLDNGYQVQTAWACYPAGAMIQIVTEVKSRLLEFLLELSEKFPEEVDPDNIKFRSKEVNVSEIFKNAMFGDNATVIIGDSNTQNVSNVVKINNLESLNDFLRENNVNDGDLTKLKKSIISDKNCEEHKQSEIGPNVSNWMKEMLSKAGTIAWDLNIGMASSILASAISKYYGF